MGSSDQGEDLTEEEVVALYDAEDDKKYQRARYSSYPLPRVTLQRC